MLRCTNLSLLILYPIAWFAPLLNAGLLPLFGLIRNQRNEWPAILVGNRCVSGPCGNSFCFACSLRKDNQFGITALEPAEQKLLQALHILGKLAMADIFLIALYVTLSKGIGSDVSKLHGGSICSPRVSSRHFWCPCAINSPNQKQLTELLFATILRTWSLF